MTHSCAFRDSPMKAWPQSTTTTRGPAPSPPINACPTPPQPKTQSAMQYVTVVLWCSAVQCVAMFGRVLQRVACGVVCV